MTARRAGRRARGASPAARKRMRQGLALFAEGLSAMTGEGSVSPAAARRTAARVEKAWTQELLRGYREDPVRLLAPIGARATGGLVVVRDLEFSSICRHHLMPFTGRVHLGYAPAGRITGLSRLSTMVDALSRRLQLQEGLTAAIARAVQSALAPEGAGCVVEASHTCMTMRGSRKAGARIVTAAFTGVFQSNPRRRRELLALLAPQSGSPVRVSR